MWRSGALRGAFDVGTEAVSKGLVAPKLIILIADLSRALANQEKKRSSAREWRTKAEYYYQRILNTIHQPGVARSKALAGMSSLYYTEGNLRKAIKFLQKASLADPYKKHHSLYALSLARIYIEKRQFRKANQLINKASTLSSFPRLMIWDMRLDLAIKENNRVKATRALIRLKVLLMKESAKRGGNFFVAPATKQALLEKIDRYSEILNLKVI